MHNKFAQKQMSVLINVKLLSPLSASLSIKEKVKNEKWVH